MKILGIILSILGCLSALYGVNLNNSLEAQFTSLLSNGSTNPGTIWICVGVIVVVVGLLLTFKKNKQN